MSLRPSSQWMSPVSLLQLTSAFLPFGRCAEGFFYQQNLILALAESPEGRMIEFLCGAQALGGFREKVL